MLDAATGRGTTTSKFHRDAPAAGHPAVDGDHVRERGLGSGTAAGRASGFGV